MKRKKKQKALDLNAPIDAVRFLLAYAVAGKLTFEDPNDVLKYSEKDLVSLAKEVFLNNDVLKAQGTEH